MNRTPDDPRSGGPRPAKGWERYWKGSGSIEAWTDEGVQHPALLEFWNDVFSAVGSNHERLVLADLASGNGAVVECALNALGAERLEATCVDLSPAAIDNIGQRFPAVKGLVCDVAAVPLESRSFTIVTSQFGVEYAGMAALAEAARLVASGGTLALLLHHSDGEIAKECQINRDAVQRVREVEFVPLALKMFRAGFAAVRGADRAPYDVAAAQLLPSLQLVEGIVAEQGEQVAGHTLANLYADIRRIHGRLAHYDPDEVLGWLERMNRELESYGRRMASMLDSALDAADFAGVCNMLQSDGCRLEQAGPMNVKGLERPVGWVVVATRETAGPNDGKMQ